jgi:hypothetical protein
MIYIKATDSPLIPIQTSNFISSQQQQHIESLAMETAKKNDVVVYEEKSSSLDHTNSTNKISDAVNLANDEAATRYSPWTWPMMRLYGVLCVAYLCGCLNGYDGSLMGGVNAMESYQNFSKLGMASSGTGLIFAIYNIGE